MVWIGGAIMALGVIFLVKIGNDHGLFGSKIRIGIATALGVIMTTGGELIRRSRFHLKLASGQYIPAALSGAGIIALYASMLSANYIYDMFPLSVLFAVLATISAVTMVLAISQGPFMAALGIIGAYMVPFFISTGSGNVSGLLIYVAVVSFGSLALLNKIYRRWLWWGALTGNYAWLLISIFIASSEHQIARGLFLLITTYGFFALPHFGWRLSLQNKNSSVAQQDGLLTGGIAALLLLVMASNNTDDLWVCLTVWLSCAGLLFIARQIALLNWLSVVGAASAILALPAMREVPTTGAALFDLHQLDVGNFPLKLILFSLLALLYAFYAVKMVIRQADKPLMWSLVSTITPTIILITLYLYYPIAWVANYGIFAKIALLAIAIIAAAVWYAVIKRNEQLNEIIKGVYSIAANIIVATALSLIFVQVELTTLLAIQMLISVALIKWRAQPVSHWVFKGLMIIILMRLSFNPAIFEYSQNLFGIPWTLYGYGIPVICLWLTTRWLSKNERYQSTMQLAQINMIYLLGLWINIELRHILHGSYHISLNFRSLTDVALHALTFGMMSLAYIYRAPLSGLSVIYKFAAKIFGSLALLLAIVGSLFIYNPLFTAQDVGSLPLLNMVTAAYGLPGIMLLILLSFWPDWLNLRFKRYAQCLLAIFGMLFITLFVRQLWHGNILSQRFIYVGEQYFYSFAWMITAIVMMTLAIKRHHITLRRASLALLCLTIIKLFIWDMSGLTGFYRPISFIGLGICLVAMGWFYQRFVILDNSHETDTANIESAISQTEETTEIDINANEMAASEKYPEK